MDLVNARSTPYADCEIIGKAFTIRNKAGSVCYSHSAFIKSTMGSQWRPVLNIKWLSITNTASRILLNWIWRIRKGKAIMAKGIGFKQLRRHMASVF